MLILCYDTETTGVIYGSDYTNPANPFLASIAMILFDTEARRVVSSFNTAILPEGWSMPPEAGAVNGLTTEYLCKVGIPASLVTPAAIALALNADLRIAHNVDFDTKIMATALWRHLQEEIADGLYTPVDAAHNTVKNWLSLPTYCTMKESKAIVGATNIKGNIKAPKLIETYRHFFGKDLDRAHSANADAVAVLEIYMALQETKEVSL
jgi:DNA polymerase III epsilon subunit-like protein